MDGPGIAGGLRAGACDLPYGLIPDLGTDLPKVNPETYRKARVQEGARPLLEVPAINPDVVIFHGQQADEEGNVQYFGAGYFDLLMAQAAKHVICSVDRIVPASTVRHDARLTKIPSAFVDAVVVTPFGAHPGAQRGPLRTGRGPSQGLRRGEPRPEDASTPISNSRPRRRGRLPRAHRCQGAGRPHHRPRGMSQAFDPIKRRRLSDQVSAEIQVRIASGELKSGDKLPPEREMAESFRVVAAPCARRCAISNGQGWWRCRPVRAAAPSSATAIPT